MTRRFAKGLLLVFLITMPLMAGCKKEAAKEEKAVPAAEKTEENIITLSLEKQKEGGIETIKISLESIPVQISATAVIELNADKYSKISPRQSGKIVSVNASIGDRVKAGQAIAYFDSVEIGELWAGYVKAKTNVELARKNLKREETLFEKKVSPEKDVLKARQELIESEADLNLSKERFRLLGIEIDKFEEDKKNGHHPLAPISSPISGAVIEKTVSLGEIVGHDKTIFTIADLSALWVVMDIYEKDISKVRAGMPVKVFAAAFPDKVFMGKISFIGDVMDEKTRTAKARVIVDNSIGLLKAGMFATVTVESAKDVEEKMLAVPEDAVLLEGASRYVFIRISPDKFEKREIAVGRMLGKNIEVLQGLKHGDTVVAKGTFALKSELKKESLEAE